MVGSATTEMSSVRRLSTQAFAIGYVALPLLFFLWLFFYWPAVANEWWINDDIAVLNRCHNGQHILKTIVDNVSLLGIRPFAFFWNNFYAFMVCAVPSTFMAGIILRLVQGFLHAVCATLVGSLFVRFSGRKLAWLTVLPFLVWPFASEATFWISAGNYQISGMLSLIGVLLCMRRGKSEWIGMALIVASSLVNQSGCLLGFVAFWICLILTLYTPGGWRELRRPFFLILAAYAIGGAISVGLTLAFQDRRVTLGTYLDQSSASYLLWSELHLLLNAPALFPQWLRFVQSAIVLSPPILLILIAFKNRPMPHAVRFATGMVMGIAILIVLPIIPQLVIGMRWFQSRLMYIIPLFFSAALCLIFQLPLRPRITSAIVACLLVTLSVGYFPLARAFSQNYVDNFSNDLATIRQLEQFGRQNGLSAIVTVGAPERKTTVNPYQLRYAWFGDILAPAFKVTWTGQYLIRQRSHTLVLLMGVQENEACRSFCTIRGNEERHLEILTSPTRFICFCP